jgi:CheY-like chemotaxis protein
MARVLKQYYNYTKDNTDICKKILSTEYFSTIQELMKYKEEQRNDEDNTFNRCICLVHEDSYNRELFQSLVEISNDQLILTTFGSQFSVSETKCHFRKLDHVLPSVLFDTLVNSLPQQRSLSSQSLDNSMSLNCSSQHYKRSRRYSNAAKDSDKIQKLKILIAEDNKINQKVLSRILERMSIKNIDIANDGKEAVELEKTNQYDLILMDMQMPNMDGVEATKHILQSYHIHDQDLMNIPSVIAPIKSRQLSIPKVVFVTAHAEPYYEQECYNAGAVAFITKPYSVHDIETLMHRLFVEKRKANT